MGYLLYPWGLVLQALAIVHFIRRRPDTYWIFVILFLGPFGVIIYLLVEAAPDLGLLRQSFKVFPRRRRIHELELAVRYNPSAGNYEELGDLYMEDGTFARARECFDRPISSQTDSPDPFYRRGACAVAMGDFSAAITDLERVVTRHRAYDFYRAAGLLAHSYANTGQQVTANALFRETTVISTSSETIYHYVWFLAAHHLHVLALQL